MTNSIGYFGPALSTIAFCASAETFPIYYGFLRTLKPDHKMTEESVRDTLIRMARALTEANAAVDEYGAVLISVKILRRREHSADIEVLVTGVGIDD